MTVSVPTNEDVADVSRAIRERRKARGEIGADEVAYKAVDQRGETYALPIATGDRLRLFRSTWARIDGRGGWIGNNGNVVEVVGRTDAGLQLRDKDGRVGDVEWRRLSDPKTGRLLLGFGDALTIDAAQGITSGEHIAAFPRGTAGVTGFKAYVAESRAKGATWTMIAEGALHEAVKRSRALGDASPVTEGDLWDRAAADLAHKPYKSLGVDLIRARAGATLRKRWTPSSSRATASRPWRRKAGTRAWRSASKSRPGLRTGPWPGTGRRSAACFGKVALPCTRRGKRLHPSNAAGACGLSCGNSANRGSPASAAATRCAGRFRPRQGAGPWLRMPPRLDAAVQRNADALHGLGQDIDTRLRGARAGAQEVGTRVEEAARKPSSSPSPGM